MGAARLGEDDPCRGNHRATELDAYLHAKVQVKNALLARRQRIRRKGCLWAEAACAVGIWLRSRLRLRFFMQFAQSRYSARVLLYVSLFFSCLKTDYLSPKYVKK